MLLQHLSLTNFKNIAEASLDFSPGVNCFLGNNGMGKSNLLDAIYTLSFCKSFTGVNDPMLITAGADFAIAQGAYLRRGVEEKLSLGLQRGRRKSLKRQGKEYQRLSQHIGMFPLVMVAPQDIDLIDGAADERRRWMDIVISQSDPRYLDALMRYNRALEQRNRLLRDGSTDPGLFMALELPMDAAAAYINRARADWTDQLLGIFARYYAAIAGVGETPFLRYASQLNHPGATLADLLEQSRRRDEAIGHTTVGTHRDDIEMTLNDMPLRRTGSQGQCKSFSIALRLAQYEFLSKAVGLKPLLLLDDIFDKLDATRVERIMALVTADSADSGRVPFGQIFITDTNRKHLDEIVALAGADHRLWTVDAGAFTPINPA